MPNDENIKAKEYNADADPFQPIGVAGYRETFGFLDEEFLEKLREINGRRVYRQMRDNDPTLGAIVFGITSIARSLSLEVVPAETPRGQEMAEFVESLYSDMGTPLDNHVSETFEGVIPYGFSLFEIIPKRRDGYHWERGTRSSRYNDGLIGVEKLASRPSETLYRWIMMHEVNKGEPDDGEVWGFVQQPPNGGADRFLPLSRCLHFVSNYRKSSPEGVSAFRNAFRPWFFLKNFEEMEAIGKERNYAGLPVVYIPNRLLNAADGFVTDAQGNKTRLSKGDQAKARRAVGKFTSLVKDLRRNSRSGVVLPSDPYRDVQGNPTAQREVVLELLTPKGSGEVNFNDSIQRCKQDIARTFFAQFIMLGTKDAGGNRSLSKTLSELFLTALNGWMENIAQVHNTQLLPYIWWLNTAAGFQIEDMPTVKFASAKPTDLDELGKYLTALGGTGILLGGEENVEDWLLEQSGLPKPERTER